MGIIVDPAQAIGLPAKSTWTVVFGRRHFRELHLGVRPLMKGIPGPRNSLGGRVQADTLRWTEHSTMVVSGPGAVHPAYPVARSQLGLPSTHASRSPSLEE